MKHLFSFRMFESGYSGDENFIPKSMQQKRFSDISKSLNHPIHVSTDKGWWKESDDDLFIRNTDKEEKKDALIKGSLPKVEKPKEIKNPRGEGFRVELDKRLKQADVVIHISHIQNYIEYYERKLRFNNDDSNVKEINDDLKLLKDKKQELEDYLLKLKACPLEDLIDSGILNVDLHIYDFLRKLKKS